MGFRFVPKSVTLNDLERRNDHFLAFFSPNSVALGDDYVKVIEDGPISLRRKCSPTILVFSDISFIAIFTEVTENSALLIGICAIYIHFSIMTRLKVGLCHDLIEVGLSGLYGFSVRS